MNVGFIGLGHMGSGMAANLVKAGHTVTVYNRTQERTEPLVALGAKAAKNLAEACKGDAVFTMLANDDAVKSVVYGDKGVLAHLPRGAVHISSSTIEPDAIAAAGNLFDAIGQGTFNVSKTPKAANLVKLSGNFLIACVIESIGEALALVSKGGVDRRQYINILTSSLFNAPVYKTYGGLLAERNFEPAGFAAPLGHKDIRLALAAAEQMRVPMPLASLLNDRFLTLLAHGGDKLDWSAIGDLAGKDAAAG
jgi:3-hydroxyisobutyrate dehydrogenase-like beta-hydroxyacid dehydrogenase